jgi:hypothetical protein
MAEILPGVFAVDLGLWVRARGTLVLADFHLGFEEMLNQQGVFVPRINFKEIKGRIEGRVFEEVEPETIVINGDLKHEFGAVSPQEWREVIGMLEFLEEHCEKIVLVRGNHDTILGPLARRRGLEIEEQGHYIGKEKVFVCHGHKIPVTREFGKAETVVIGHEHPAVSIREGVKQETSKCFLGGEFGGKALVVQPSLNALHTGTDVLREELLSPFLQQDLGGFEAWVVEDKVYYFGKLKDLK